MGINNAIQKTEDSITNAINTSNLPPKIIELILAKIYQEIKTLTDKAILAEKEHLNKTEGSD